ncbi:MAG: polyphosphate kinase 1 [Rhodospirillaceae bacterium]|nr:polyphosphate kinase 1 [Rhodospirillaceae bacterium]
MSEAELEENFLPPQAQNTKTEGGRASKAATKARKKATAAADQTTAAAKTVAKTKRVTKKVLAEVETANLKNKATRAIALADKEAKIAAKAAAAAVNYSKRAAKLARDSETSAALARKAETAAIKARARAKGAQIEAVQAERRQDYNARTERAFDRRVAKLSQIAETAEIKAEAAAKKVSALASRAKAEADAAVAKVKEAARAVKQTEAAARKAEDTTNNIPPGTKETVAETTAVAGQARSRTKTAVDGARASVKAVGKLKTVAATALAAAASKAEADQAAERAVEAAAKAARALAETGKDLKAPELYLNRELTWLNFNKRVLHEAEDPRTPLLERVKFLAIVDSNLDEFFMKRIGGLKQQVGAGVHDLTIDGRSPVQQIHESVELVRDIQRQMHEIYLILIEKLRENNIFISSCADLLPDELAGVRAYYLENIFPLVTPLAMDPAHPFPHISNLSLNLLVTLHTTEDATPLLARVKVPTGNAVPRFVPVGTGNQFVLLEDVMASNLDVLFPDVEIVDCEIFRVTRNANTERDEDIADDLLEMIESEIRDRKFAPIVRLETGAEIRPLHKGMLAAELGLNEKEDVFESDVMLGLRDLFEIAGIDEPSLHDPDHHPIDNIELQDDQNIFHIIRNKGPILLQHPYESFNTSVVRFVREACRDPKVLAIKMTLYRTTEDTGIIDYLIEASRNGKQVAVAVELKARFDETANIKWASRLEEAGIHVTYGVVGLKTHSKLVLVIRRDYNGLSRYAHIGTGNYHSGTARLYSDFGLLTCDPAVGSDLIEFFNFLTSGCQPKRRYSKILVSPRNLKDQLLAKIDREISKSSSRSPGLIRLKTNALEDPDITEALYRASMAEVKIELIIRDTCRIRPGIPGLSDNIRVISVVGRFLEHSRIYYFRNGGNEEYFIGSADLMMRNLESRAEVVVIVDDEHLCQQLHEYMEMQLNDSRNVWDMMSDSSYVHRLPEGEQPGSHWLMIEAANKRHQDAQKAELRRPKAIAKRSKRG